MYNQLFDNLVSEAEFKEELIEKFAALEHEQWVYWAKKILEEEDIDKERAARWKALFVPYTELEEADKEDDRKWARKVLDIVEE